MKQYVWRKPHGKLTSAIVVRESRTKSSSWVEKKEWVREKQSIIHGYTPLLVWTHEYIEITARSDHFQKCIDFLTLCIDFLTLFRKKRVHWFPYRMHWFTDPCNGCQNALIWRHRPATHTRFSLFSEGPTATVQYNCTILLCYCRDHQSHDTSCTVDIHPSSIFPVRSHCNGRSLGNCGGFR